jgi:hypothetical protein
MKKPDLMMDSEMEQPVEQAPEDKNMFMEALRKARDAYGSYDPAASTDRVAKMIARKMAEKGQLVAQEGETPEMAEERLASGMSQAGQMGMQAGMSAGSIAPIGAHSQVAKGLAQEIGALGKAQSLSNLGAKAGDASKVINNSPKMSPEQLALMAKKLGF